MFVVLVLPLVFVAGGYARVPSDLVLLNDAVDQVDFCSVLALFSVLNSECFRAQCVWTDLLRATTFELEALTARISGSSTWKAVVGAQMWGVAWIEAILSPVAPR